MSSLGSPRVGSGGVGRHTLPRAHRLLRRADFRRVQATSDGLRSPHLVVLHTPRHLEAARFGLVVSRKVGNAVVRNRVKRWLREAVRRHRGALTFVDVVLIARSGAATAGFAKLEREVARALHSLSRRPGEPPAGPHPEGP